MSSFNCYQCNSLDHPECADLHAYPPHNVSVFHQPCEGDYGDSGPFCRKITYKCESFDESKSEINIHWFLLFYFIAVKFLKSTDLAASRIVRSCGREKSTKDCYNADNDHHFETVCQCFSDGCNGADNLPVFHLISFFMMAITARYLL